MTLLGGSEAASIQQFVPDMRFPRAIQLFIVLSLSSALTSAKQKCADIHSSVDQQEQAQESTRFHAPSTFIERIFPFLRPALTVDDFAFSGHVLSLSQLKALSRFSSRAKKPLIKGDQLFVVGFEEMRRQVPTEFGIQKIHKNGVYENKLLELSDIDVDPREVLSFRFHLANGQIVEAPIIVKGDVNSVNFKKGSSDLYNYLRGDVSGIQIIEIAHTHPTYAVRVLSIDGSSKFRANEISEGDFQAATSFARRIPPGKTVIIKAILPNGFNYQLEIPTGR